MKKIKQFLRSEWLMLTRGITIAYLKSRAKRLWVMTGKQHHVVPTNEGRFIVVNNQWVNAFNKIVKDKGKHITSYDLAKMSVYSTPATKEPRVYVPKAKKKR